MAFWKFQHFNLVSKISQKLFKPLPFISFNIWQYWKNVACHLHICSGGFTQVSKLWPVGLLFYIPLTPIINSFSCIPFISEYGVLAYPGRRLQGSLQDGRPSILHPSVVRPSFFHTIDQLYLHSLQADLIYSMPLMGHRWCKLSMEIQWKPWLL